MTDVAIDRADAAPPEPVPGAAGPIGGSGLGARLSDWLNPILVREVQQAIKGRAFVILVNLTLLFSVGLAAYVAGFEEVSPRLGQGAFSGGLLALAPLVLFVVPMTAFQSMRLEMRAGIVEQLLLSRLRPMRIITGKLAAAMVQYFLYLAVLAPVLAMTYLLRGVDVPTIAWSLSLSLTFCLTATAVAIAAAAMSFLPMLQPIASLGVAFALGMTTVGVMAAIGDGQLLRELNRLMVSTQWVVAMSAMLLICLFSVILATILAAIQLAHSYENRSTPLRVYLLALFAAGFGWAWVFVPAGSLFLAVFALAMCGIVGLGIGSLFFVTETRSLSPRHITRLPRSRLLRLLLVPLLPGRDRGVLFMLSVLVGLAALLWWSWPGATAATVGGSVAMRPSLWQGLLYSAAYLVIYAMLLRLLRGLLPESAAGSYLGRVALPLMLVAFCAVPGLFDVLIAGRVSGWHVGHALNPFWTMEFNVGRDTTRSRTLLVGLWAFAGVLVLVTAPQLVRAVREVLTATSRRERELDAT